MQIYHRDCTWLPMWFRVMFGMRPTTSRMRRRLHELDEVMSTETYVCEVCGDSVHIDTDFPDD